MRYWRQEKAAEVDAQKHAEAEAEAEYVAFSAQIKALSEAHEESKQAIMAGRRKGAFLDNITLAERKQRQAQAEREKQAEIEACVLHRILLMLCRFSLHACFGPVFISLMLHSAPTCPLSLSHFAAPPQTVATCKHNRRLTCSPRMCQRAHSAHTA